MDRVKLKSLLITVFGILVTCLLVVNSFTANTNTYAKENKQGVAEEKILCTASINDDFADDSVLVVMDSEIGESNKVNSASYFKGLDIDRIEDLTVRKNNVTNEDNTFNQILQIYLKHCSKENVLKAIAKLEKLNSVYSAEPNYFAEPTMVPNDDYYANGSQWNLNGTGGINMESAWTYTQGNKDVRVGIIDTGIANHSDLNDNLVDGYDFYNNNATTTDDTYGHGTLVAGIIGAKGNNNDGVAGINWNVTLVPLQAADKNNLISSSEVVKAIKWAESKWGTSEQIDIINYSVGGFGVRTALLESIKAYQGLFIWSAGNDGNNVDLFADIDKFNVDNLISVGAIDKNNERSVWGEQSSNYGNKVNIFAPGGSGFSNTFPGENIPSTDNSGSYSRFHGTSCAAPHVAGVAALMLSVNPNLSASQLKDILLDTTDSINITIPTSSGGTTTQTVKKLNAYKAVKSVHTHSYSDTYTSLTQQYHEKSCTICGESIRSAHWAYSGNTGRFVKCVECGIKVDTYLFPILIIKLNSLSLTSIDNSIISTTYQLEEYLNLQQTGTLLTSEEIGEVIEYYDEKFFAQYSVMFGDIDGNEVLYWLLKNATEWQTE